MSRRTKFKGDKDAILLGKVIRDWLSNGDSLTVASFFVGLTSEAIAVSTLDGGQHKWRYSPEWLVSVITNSVPN